MRYLIIMLTSAFFTKKSTESKSVWVILIWFSILILFMISAILWGLI